MNPQFLLLGFMMATIGGILYLALKSIWDLFTTDDDRLREQIKTFWHATAFIVAASIVLWLAGFFANELLDLGI